MISQINKYSYTNFPKQYGQFMAFKSSVLLPLKLIIFRLGFHVFFGGKKQDEWVAKDIFKLKKKGFFIDLASTDGIHQNNTYVLEKRLNWSGICIEPNASFFNRLKKNRNCICVNSVVSKNESNVKFFENGGIGGIIGDKYDNNYQKRSALLSKKKNFRKIKNYRSTTLLSILKKFNAPKTIDYLSLDVEGSEEEILKKFPFKKYKFLTLTIERPSKSLNKLLFKNKYLFVKNYKVDTFYIHKSLQKKIDIKLNKFEQIGKKKW